MIRKANINDMDQILRVYETAREFMHTHGNPTQWANKYPDSETLADDISKEQLYVITRNDRIHGCFAMIFREDPTYKVIYEGEWKDNTPYAAIHRVASDGAEKGIFKECFEFASAKSNHLRIDTHRDNKPMQGAIEKCGFEYCGIIHLPDGASRIAFEWTKK